ncbi:UDP-N-acetylglucosamine 2-epimerase (non-hydrolyzing) [Demequina sp. TTPB684]|uniref:non-hydrolyzing UDP-N-acetylglucosamine 2-epimerase n=1 Tax=unclassified Demequina TaxID=2620311 RepID=UPI001CF22EE9|nr:MULTISPECIES: UDP-N-acetylglucosamine 2-epimerase (non-hydrolyzing) [unclassified Demequina]MCB2413611.1 UDP-N-acetylglucosamine 2-epimerase (non-hydrolyzing) [Demequina sp. TTPB684]UPU88265.1 UDP-N-acetylglucosamine 2-epimerase (non-hydrolyzing) [Demequina sp. TMPB413]
MKILSVVGARPQFVKLAPISKALEGRAEHLVVHTGQHYDDLMSDVFFRDLGMPAPTVNLGVGSGSHGRQTGQMLGDLEEQFERLEPDWVLVYGDTNSTLAAALAAVKIHVPVAHLEAGLRSFNRRMPEEHNRVMTDHAADLLLAPTRTAMHHLAREGLADRTVLVGDVMTDVLYTVRDRLLAEPPQMPHGLEPGGYYVATLHRPDNTDDPGRLRGIVAALAKLDRPVLLLAHPRLRSLALQHDIRLDQGELRINDPLSYPDLVAAVMYSAGVVTDSGGLQKEAFLLRVPATTIRPETEWVETVDLGWNALANDSDAIASAVSRPLPLPTTAAPYGDGRAAEAVADELLGERR